MKVSKRRIFVLLITLVGMASSPVFQSRAAQSGKLKASPQTGPIWGLSWSAHGKLASVTPFELVVWTDRVAGRAYQIPAADGRKLQWHPSGDQVLLGGWEGGLGPARGALIDLRRGVVVHRFEEGSQSVSWVDGYERIVSGSPIGRRLTVYSARTLQVERVLRAGDIVRGLALAPDGNRLLTYGFDNLSLWLPGAEQLPSMNVDNAGVRRATWAPRGELAVVQVDRPRVVLWDTERKARRTSFSAGDGEIEHWLWSGTGDEIAFLLRSRKRASGRAREAGQIVIWSPRTQEQRTWFSGDVEAFAWCSYDAEPALLVVGKDSIRIVTRERIAKIRPGRFQWDVVLAVAPDGRIAATGEANGDVRFWQLPELVELD